MKHLVASLIIFALSASAAVAAEKKDDSQLIQGRWKIVKAMKNGKEREGSYELHVSATQLSVMKVGADHGDSVDYRLDASKTPRAMDLVNKREAQERILPAIYELDGDKLRICYAKKPDAPRPTSFESNPGDGLTLMIMERIKEEKK